MNGEPLKRAPFKHLGEPEDIPPQDDGQDMKWGYIGRYPPLGVCIYVENGGDGFPYASLLAWEWDVEGDCWVIQLHYEKANVTIQGQKLERALRALASGKMEWMRVGSNNDGSAIRSIQVELVEEEPR